MPLDHLSNAFAALADPTRWVDRAPLDQYLRELQSREVQGKEKKHGRKQRHH